MMPDKLKSCPFCGSEDVELRAGALFNGAVHCNNCSADVVFDAVRMIAEGDYDWKTAVTNGWNIRAEIKHGKWIINRSPVEAEIRCSECGYSFIEADPNAEVEFKGCPMCLARMEEKEICNV